MFCISCCLVAVSFRVDSSILVILICLPTLQRSSFLLFQSFRFDNGMNRKQRWYQFKATTIATVQWVVALSRLLNCWIMNAINRSIKEKEKSETKSKHRFSDCRVVLFRFLWLSFRFGTSRGWYQTRSAAIAVLWVVSLLRLLEKYGLRRNWRRLQRRFGFAASLNNSKCARSATVQYSNRIWKVVFNQRVWFVRFEYYLARLDRLHGWRDRAKTMIGCHIIYKCSQKLLSKGDLKERATCRQAREVGRWNL